MMTSPQPPHRAGASTWPAALVLWGTGAKSSPHSHQSCPHEHSALSGASCRHCDLGRLYRFTPASQPASSSTTSTPIRKLPR